MKKAIRISLILFVVFTYVFKTNAQQISQLWVSKFESRSHFEDRGYDAVIDNNGNIIVAGSESNGCTGYDYVTICYNSNGDTLWRSVYSGVNDDQEDRPSAICTDNQNNVYITGASDSSYFEYMATVKYDPSGNEIWSARFNLVSAGNDVVADANGNVFVCGYSKTSSDKDLILVKYNSTGIQQWVRTYSNGFYDEGVKLMINVNNEVVVTGISSGSTFVSKDVVTIEYDQSGNQQWLQTWNAPITPNYTDEPVDMGVDANNNIFICVNSYYQNSSNIDYAILKYDIDGNFLWASNYDSPYANQDTPYEMAVDKDGNTYTIGISIRPGFQYDYLTVKFNPDGQFVWAQRQDSTMRNDYGRTISLDTASNSLYVCGDMNLGFNTIYERRNYVVFQYDTSGALIKTFGYQGPGDGFDIPYKLLSKPNGDVFIAGMASTFSSGYGDVATIKFSNGSLQWERLDNGYGFVDDQGNDMVSDSAGNTYSCGFSYSNEYTTGNDLVVVKNNANGIKLWDYHYRGLQEFSRDEATHICIDNAGYVYVTGITDSSVNQNNTDIYIAKIDPMGTLVWDYIYAAQANGNDKPAGILTDASGNVFVSATCVNPVTGFDGTLISLDLQGSVNWISDFDRNNLPQSFNTMVRGKNQEIYCAGTNIASAGYYTDALLVRFDAAGSAVWDTTYDSNPGSNFDRDFFNCIEVDLNGDVIAGGVSGLDFLVAKYSTGGSPLWIETYDNNSLRDSVSAITIDPFNNVIATGITDLTFGTDYLTVKYNSTGNLLWDKKLANQAGSEDVPYDILTDSAGTIYITGYETANFTTNYNFFTVLYDSAGTFKGELLYSDSLGNSPDYGKRIAKDNAGNIYVMGNANQPCWGNTFINGYRFDITTIKYGTPSSTSLVQHGNIRESITILPNPSNEHVLITFPDEITRSCMLRIYNITGTLVYENSEFNSNELINTTELTEGVYSIVLYDANNTNSYIGRLVVMH